MSDSESSDLNSSSECNHKETTRSSDSPCQQDDTFKQSATDIEIKKEPLDNQVKLVEKMPVNSTELTRRQIKWVFATTCYAFGVLKREFNSRIDEELIAVIKSKLNDEPGFHNDTLDFGNNHFQDQLEQVVRNTWQMFQSSENSLDFLTEHGTQDNNNEQTISNTDNNHNQSSSLKQQNQSCATDDNSTSSAIEQNKATPNSSTGGDSALNELHMFNDSQGRKVYLGGLSDDITERDLREYFSEYGTLADINIVVHKDTGKRRGFAFVEYEEQEPADKIVAKKFHTIKKRRVEAKKAIPKVEMDARKRVDRISISDAMMVLRGGGPPYLWDSLASPYGPGSNHHLHAPPPPLHPSSGSYQHLDQQHTYPHHYNSPGPYGGGGAGGGSSSSSAWLMHGGGRGSLNGYPSQAGNGNSWASSVAAAASGDYSRIPVDAMAAAAGGGIGPMRPFGYAAQHARSYRPYTTGGSGSGGCPGGGQRARGFK